MKLIPKGNFPSPENYLQLWKKKPEKRQKTLISSTWDKHITRFRVWVMQILLQSQKKVFLKDQTTVTLPVASRDNKHPIMHLQQM